MPILSLSTPIYRARSRFSGMGAFGLDPGQSITSKWKADLVAEWKKQWDATSKIYGGKGLVESFSGSWEETLNELSARHYFNHPKGEVPDDVVQKWYDGWNASLAQDVMHINGTIPGFLQWGRWNFVFDAARRNYLDTVQQREFDKVVTDAQTLYLMAERAAAKLFLDTYGKLLSGWGQYLSGDEKEFLRHFFLDWKEWKSDDEKARAAQILQRIKFTYTTPERLQDELHKVYIAAGGKEEDWMKYPSNSSTEQIISNGSSTPITAVNWNQVNANQKVVTAQRDDGFVSPLNTMFLTPAARAGQPVNSTSASVAPSTIHPAVLAGGAWLLFKLFWR